MACLPVCFSACGKKAGEASNSVPPVKRPEAPETTAAADTAGAKAATESDSALPVPSVPVPATTQPAETARVKPAFASHPPAKGYPGKPYRYQPALNVPGAFKLAVLTAADSSMKTEKGRLAWTPAKAGHYPVILEATLAGTPGKDQEIRVRQEFTVIVDKVLTLRLGQLSAQVNKGDTVTFDLKGSVWPAWAAEQVTVRFDYEGDGVWDSEALPLAAHLSHKYAYAQVGRFRPKVEARYAGYESQEAEAAITVVSSVMPVLKISPDTVEPGGEFRVDATESKSDGRLAFSLDVDGDGKPEWIDSVSGRTTLKAPASGLYQVALTARNPMGQEGKTSAVLRVNARPKLEWKVRNPKENMAANVDFKIHGKDADDSLRSVRLNFTGEEKDWETRAAPDSQSAGKEWWLRLRHVYGKVGKYTAGACIASADGREVCQEVKIEIFNAPPVCQPGADLHATLGKPVQIDGTGNDPDGKIVKWEWDLNGDGKYDLVSGENGKFQYTFSKEGKFDLVLRVTTADGMRAKGNRKVEVRKKWKS